MCHGIMTENEGWDPTEQSYPTTSIYRILLTNTFTFMYEYIPYSNVSTMP